MYLIGLLFILFFVLPKFWLSYTMNRYDKELSKMPFNAKEFGELILKGKSKALKIYEPVSGHYPQRDLYETAYKYLESGRNHEAIKVFTSLIANNRSDALIQYHISRIKNGESGVLIKAKDK